MAFTHRIGILAAVLVTGLVTGLVTPLAAQENLDQGKSAAQLFASDCAICHKSARGLASKLGRGLQPFLRQHYTASRQTAAAVAGYLQSVDAKAAPRSTRRSSKPAGDGKPKLPEPKLPEPKPAGAKPADKPGDKPEQAKAAAPDAKPAEAKPAEAKPSEAKPTETKPTADKAAEPAKTGQPEKKSE
jgi:hypothetical protein